MTPIGPFQKTVLAPRRLAVNSLAEPWPGLLTIPALSSSVHRRGVTGTRDQPDPSGLQPLGQDPAEALVELITKCGIGGAEGPHGRRVEFEGLHRGDGHGPERPLVRREQ